jgi:hypothetical protein
MFRAVSANFASPSLDSQSNAHQKFQRSNSKLDFFLMGHKGSQTSNETRKKRFRLRSFDYLRRHETGALTIDDTRCCDPGSMSIMLRSSRHALTGVLRTISHASSRFWLRAEPRGFRDVQLPDLLIECVDWRRSTRFIDI